MPGGLELIINRPSKTDDEALAAAHMAMSAVVGGISFDDLEAEMARSGLVMPPAPLIHRFTKGMYIREIYMPKGAMLTSKIHKTQHPFVVSLGLIEVAMEGGPTQLIEAPFTGITEPGTRRLLLAHADTIWTTFHPNPTDERDLDKIEEMLILKHDEHIKRGGYPCLSGQ